MPRHKILILFVLLYCCGVGIAQQEMQLPVFHTLSVLPHTGQLGYNISLYRIKDPDFEWTIGMNYTSDGFRPLIYSGIAGDGWALQAGGSITREVVGIADDMLYEENIYGNTGQILSKNIQKGLWAVLQDSSYPTQTTETIYEGDFGNEGIWADALHYNRESHVIDLESDIYTFAFNGYSGKFMIGMDGKAIIVSGDYADIDLSGMSVQKKKQYHNHDFFKSPIYLHPKKSTIIITTLDGYRYTFGGNDEALEYTQILPSNDNPYTYGT